MTGSLQVKGNKYYAVLNFKDEKGKRVPKWFKTDLPVKGNTRRAESFLARLITEYEGKELIKKEESSSSQKNQLFARFVQDWIKEIEPTGEKNDRLERSTWEAYESYTRCHIIPYFEELGVTIEDLTKEHIKAYYHDKARGGRKDKKAGGLGYKSLKDHAKVLKKVLEEAVEEQLIPTNIAKGIKIPNLSKDEELSNQEEPVFLSAEEANRVLEAFQGHRLQVLVLITLYYGLRRSEVIGLKWSALDFDEMTMKIRHVIVKSRTIEAKNRTKSKASGATFELLPEVKEALLDLKEQQEKNKGFYGDQYHDNEYVFCWDDGTPYRPDYITRAFQSQLKKCGLPKMTFHGLRHSCASILYDKGWELKDIQEWLRHADIETTGDIYVHISKSRKKIMSQRLQNTFHL